MGRGGRDDLEALKFHKHPLFLRVKIFTEITLFVSSPRELKTTMKSLGQELSRNELKQMMREADRNKDGGIDFDGKYKNTLHNYLAAKLSSTPLFKGCPQEDCRERIF